MTTPSPSHLPGRPPGRHPGRPLSRRGALSGAATIGLGLPVLVACGAGDQSATDPAGATSATPRTPSGTAPSTTPGTTPGTTGAGESAPSAPAEEGIAAAADVPVGGGVVLEGPAVVLTQPTEGDFRCFTAVCTHTGCLVGSVTTTINCPCHGSTFDLSTGDVLGGPAGAPLAEVPFSVRGGRVSLA